MASLITLSGIDQAISDLNYRNTNALKSKLVHQIRQYYIDERSIGLLREIKTDDLVKALWETGNRSEVIKNRRKNLNSIKSSVNSELAKLYEMGKNPEGIRIGDNNIFVMAEEAKDKALKALGYEMKGDGTPSLSQMLNTLKLLSETLPDYITAQGKGTANDLEAVDHLKNLVQGLSEKIEVVEDVETDDDLEAVEDVETEEDIEEIDEVEADDDLEEVEEEADLEEIEEAENLDEDELLEDIDESDLEPDEEAEEVGLPVDSLGQDYSSEIETQLKDVRLLAEKFDGYLGAMDRYFNHYIYVAQGDYTVGNPKPKKDERREQIVPLSPFYIGRFPVTNGLFEIFVEKTGYQTAAEKVGYGTVYYGRFRNTKDESTGLATSTWNSSLTCKTVKGACWYQPSGPGSSLHHKRTHPVVQISLEDAMAFAAWTGKRLPTEDEWEAASRTSNGLMFPWGEDWQEDVCNTEESCHGDTTPVDQYIEFANGMGVADVLGNVLEWTRDDFRALSDNDNRSRDYVAKGGSWTSGENIRLCNRLKLDREAHSNILGFRCVAD